jgi:hypothetical protein
MPTWTLVVVADQEYRIPVGKDESVAVSALAEARNHIGRNGTVTIADRLSLRAEKIVSVRIEEQADPSGPRIA